MHQNIFDVICIIFSVPISILVGVLVHHHFADPDRLPSRSSDLTESADFADGADHVKNPDSALQ